MGRFIAGGAVGTVIGIAWFGLWCYATAKIGEQYEITGRNKGFQDGWNARNEFKRSEDGKFIKDGVDDIFIEEIPSEKKGE